MTMAVAAWSGTYEAEPGQVCRVRRDVRDHLDGCPAADDVVLIVSELAANSVRHSLSGFLGLPVTVRVERHGTWVRVEVEDAGGCWLVREQDDRAHGLDIVDALTSGRWAATACLAGRQVWARIDF